MLFCMFLPVRQEASGSHCPPLDGHLVIFDIAAGHVYAYFGNSVYQIFRAIILDFGVRECHFIEAGLKRGRGRRFVREIPFLEYLLHKLIGGIGLAPTSEQGRYVTSKELALSVLHSRLPHGCLRGHQKLRLGLLGKFNDLERRLLRLWKEGLAVDQLMVHESP